MIICQITAADSLSPEQYKSLAEAINEWCRAESERRRDTMVELDGRALASLRNGEMPRPLGERMAALSGLALAEVEATLGGDAASRAVEVRVYCDDRQGVETALREAIPAELVGELKFTQN
jgi:hypothetical protein